MKESTNKAFMGDKYNNAVTLNANTKAFMILRMLHLQQSAITDHTLEVLVDTCKGSLKEIDVSFCCNITNAGLGYLVDKIGDQFESITIWG